MSLTLALLINRSIAIFNLKIGLAIYEGIFSLHIYILPHCVSNKKAELSGPFLVNEALIFLKSWLDMTTPKILWRIKLLKKWAITWSIDNFIVWIHILLLLIGSSEMFSAKKYLIESVKILNFLSFNIWVFVDIYLAAKLEYFQRMHCIFVRPWNSHTEAFSFAQWSIS